MSSGKLAIRKGVERPKPLKSTTVIANNFVSPPADAVASADKVLELYGLVAKALSAKRYDRSVVSCIVALNSGLKVYGLQLEQNHKEVLDRYQAFLRNACRDGTLDLVARLQLLEIIELRAMKWKTNENVTNYYKQKLLQVEQCDPMYNEHRELNANASEFQPASAANFLASATASLSSLLSVNSVDQVPPGQVMANSGKFDKPTKIPGKPQLKDEVVIRNSDSGKVSETGAKERLVQIIGPDESKIETAKGLIEETIQRNQTPEINDDKEANNNEAECSSKMVVSSTGSYSYTVEVGQDSIKILGGNPDLVRAAKLVLDDYFASKKTATDDDVISMASEDNPQAIRYDRRQLLAYSNSPFCHEEPTNWSPFWETLKQENPNLARNSKEVSKQQEEEYFKPSPEHFMHKNPRFPNGFVIKNPFSNDHQHTHPKMSHLDRLFANGAGGDGGQVSAVKSLLDGAKVWDDSKNEWVTERPSRT